MRAREVGVSSRNVVLRTFPHFSQSMLTPMQYISTILLCCPGENHDSTNYSLHFLVSEGGRMPHSTEHGKTSPTMARLMQSSTVINGRWCHIRWWDRNAVDHRRYDVSIVMYL